jgi:hypothetical protein
MNRVRRRLVAAITTVALGACATAASDAGAATELGSLAPSGTTGGCFGCATIQAAEGTAGTSYVTPTSGVIVSWSMRGGSGSGSSTLLVWRPDGASRFRLVAESEPGLTTPNSASPYPTRIPVAAGDHLGLRTGDSPGGVAATFPSADAADVTFDALGGPMQGQTVGAGGDVGASINPNYLVNVAATLEPDVDADGYGDESQDNCPSVANPDQDDPDGNGVGSACELDLRAPETRIDEAPKRKLKTQTRRKRVTFEFSADEPGVTFTCNVNARVPKPCTSPLTLKMRPGKHRFYVSAIDAAGNVDISAAMARFKIVRR